MRGIFLPLLFSTAFFSLETPAQTATLETFTAANGLSQGMVQTILQGRRGFLWFGTRDGLNRYDGYRFEVFRNDRFDPFSLCDNVVRALLEDRFGRLWVGTENNGLSIFDPETGRFHHIRPGAGGLVSQKINGLAETPDGSVWASCEGGLQRVRLPERLPADRTELAGIAQIETFAWETEATTPNKWLNIFVELCATPDGRLWATTEQAIWTLDPRTGQRTEVSRDPRFGAFITTNFHLFPGPDGSVWVTQDGRIVQIAADGTVRSWPFLPQAKILQKIALCFDREATLFVTRGANLYRIPAAIWRSGQPFEFKNYGIGLPFPGETTEAYTLFSDKNGLLWLGTNGYGIRKFNPAPSPFRHFLPGKSLRAVRPDGHGQVWTLQAQRLDLASGKLSAPPPYFEKLAPTDFLFTPGSRPRNPVPGEQFWVLCPQAQQDFLLKMNPRTLAPERIFPLGNAPSQFSQMLETPDGRIWAVGNDSQIARFDPLSGQVQHFDFQEITGFREAIFHFYRDGSGTFWLGTPHGLVRATAKNDGSDGLDFALFKNDPANPASLANDQIAAVLDDSAAPAERLWVGTKGGGLHLLEKKTGKVIHRFTTADGLPNNVIYGILADGRGQLWLSTNLGISLFEPQSVHFQNFSAADDLQDDEFNTFSFAAGPDGTLFFGGINGLTAFRPADVVSSDAPAVVRISGLKILNRMARPGDGILEKSLDATQRIVVPFSKNQLTIEFAAMDFTAPQRNQYRYRLVGTKGDWTETSTSNSATYANIAPGNYVFEVVTGGSRGVWNGTAARLEIQVLPPWWRSNLAYLFYFLLVAGAIFAANRAQIQRIKLRNERDFEHREAQRLAALDRMKTEFFSSVTHEFRTPLTLILEPVRQVLQEKQHAAAHPRLQLVENNARRLLRYVNQLLDLGKIEHRQMPLELRRGDLAATLRTVFEEFRPLAEKRGIALVFRAPEDLPDAVFDVGKVEEIAQNLLSNALKFTEKGGTVKIELTADLSIPKKSGLTNLVLTVSDTGSGIPPEDLPRVFERYFQSAKNVEAGESQGGRGTGIGLALVKEFAEMMGGSVAAASDLGKGSTFTIRLPFVVEGSGVGDLTTFEKLSNLENLAAKSPASPSLNRPIAQSLTALVVEDNPELRAFIRQSLPGNWEIAEAADGAEGIEKALEMLPDAIISDVMMPRKDGLELLDFLKNDPRTSHIPVVLLTAKSALESRLAGIRRGADAYLTKPFHSEELVATIENLVATRARLRQIFSKTADETSVRASVEQVAEPSENEFLRRLLGVLEENLDNGEMSADEFARSVFMSRSQLHRKLTALTGQSLGDFVRNHRLDRAREMLRGGFAVREAAAQTGFASSKHFSTVFRQRFGVAPSEAR